MRRRVAAESGVKTCFNKMNVVLHLRKTRGEDDGPVQVPRRCDRQQREAGEGQHRHRGQHTAAHKSAPAGAWYTV